MRFEIVARDRRQSFGENLKQPRLESVGANLKLFIQDGGRQVRMQVKLFTMPWWDDRTGAPQGVGKFARHASEASVRTTRFPLLA